jgi:phosphatidylglycerol:prolipoprotein diacylglycerol transferase
VRTVYLCFALVLTIRLNARQGIHTGTTLGAFWLGVPAGIVGAHVLDMLEYWGQHGGIADILGPSGSSIYGAFVVVVPVLWLYASSQGVSPLRFLDAGAPAMALGEAMTRVGCFLNGCCYGVPWSGPLAIVFPPESFAYRDQIARGLLPSGALHSLPVHPVQLYSAAVALAAFLLLLRMFLRPHREGAVFYAFLIFYGMLRLGMAPLRQEALQSMVAFSLGFIAVGTLGLLLARRVVTAPAKPTRRLSPVR